MNILIFYTKNFTAKDIKELEEEFCEKYNIPKDFFLSALNMSNEIFDKKALKLAFLLGSNIGYREGNFDGKYN